MADIPVLRSKEQIFGDLTDGILARLQNVTDFSRQSVIVQILEAIAQVNFKSSADVIQMIDASSIDRAVGEALQRLARDRNVPISSGTYASGIVSITDTSFSKVATTVYAGQPAPVAGSQLIYVTDASNMKQQGSIYIGRGTPNVEGPLSYISVASAGGGAYWVITLDPSSLTTKFHNIGETIVMGQGGNRTVSQNTIVQTPQNAGVSSVSFKTTSKATILDGDTTVDNVPVVCTQLGTAGNVPKGAIQQAVGLPFAASVNNPRPFANGAPPDNNDAIRQRIKDYEQAKSKGTANAIKLSALNVVAPDELKKVVSSNVITYSDGGSALIFDDGTGYEPLYTGVGLEQIVDSALGGEQELQVRNYPIAQARVKNSTPGPYDIQDSEAIQVNVTGDIRIHYFKASDFKVLGSATVDEVVNSINTDPNFHCFATTADNKTYIALYPRDRYKNDITVVSLNSNDANAALGFPLNTMYTGRFYRNDIALYEDGIIPTLSTRSKATWAVNISSGDTLVYSVDSSPSITVTFTTEDFQAVDSTATVSSLTDISVWLQVFNRKMPGVSASLSGDQIVFTSNLGASNRASLKFTGGTLLDRIFTIGDVLFAQGRVSDYTLNKQTGQLSLTTSLSTGEQLTLGSSFTRAKILTGSIPDGAAMAGAAWFIIDGAVQIIPNGLKSNTAITFGTEGSSKITIVGTSAGSLPEGFEYAEAGDWVLVWADEALPPPTDDATLYPILYQRRGYWRIDTVTAGKITIDVGDNTGFASGSLAAIPTDRIVIVRSAAPIQQLNFPIATLSQTATNIENSLAGIQTEIIGAKIRISTLTANNKGEIAVIAADTGAKSIGLQPNTIVNNIDSHYGFNVTSDSEAGTPTFTHSSLTLSSGSMVDSSYLNVGGTKDNFAEILDSYEASTLHEITNTNKGVRFLTEDFDPSTNIVAYKAPAYLNSSNPLHQNDRYFLRSSYQFDSKDSVTFIVDSDVTTKTYTTPVARRLTVNTHSTPSIQSFSADDAESSLALSSTSSFYDFDFKDFKAWRQASNILTNGTYSVKINSADFGPSGNYMRVGFVYPSSVTQTSLSYVASSSEVASLGIVLPVNAPRTANWNGDSAFTTNVSTSGGKDTITYTWRVGTQPNFGAANVAVGDVVFINNLCNFLPANRNFSGRVSNTTNTSFSVELPAGTVQPDNIQFQNIINQYGIITVITSTPHSVSLGDRIGFWNTAPVSTGNSPMDSTFYPLSVSNTTFTVTAPTSTPGGSIASGSHSGGIVTITTPTSSPHNLYVGNAVLISNAGSGYDGLFPVYKILSSNKFQYLYPGASGDISSGRFDYQSLAADPSASISISSISCSGTSTVTVNTTGNHGLTTGNIVNIFGDTVSAWSNATTYALNSIILYSGNLYQSLQNANTGNTPNVSPTWWQLIVNNPVDGNFVVLSTPSLTSFTYQCGSSVTLNATGGIVQKYNPYGKLARCVGNNKSLLAFAQVGATAQQVADWVNQNASSLFNASVIGSGTANIAVSTRDLGAVSGYISGSLISIDTIKGSRIAKLKLSVNVPTGSDIVVTTGASGYSGSYAVLDCAQSGSYYIATVQSSVLAKSTGTISSSSGTFTGYTAYLMLQDGENWIKSTNLQSAPSVPQFVLKQNWKNAPASGEEIRLIACTAEQLSRFWSNLNVTGLSNVAKIDYSQYGRQVQITTQEFGASGSIEVTGGRANSGSVAIVGSGNEHENQTGSFDIPYAARIGLNSGFWIKINQTVRQNKIISLNINTVLNVFTNGIEISSSVPSTGSFQTKRTVTPNNTSIVKIEKHGDYVAFIGIAGTSLGLLSDSSNFVREGDWVRIKNTLTGNTYNTGNSYSTGSRVDYNNYVWQASATIPSGSGNDPDHNSNWVKQEANFSNEGIFQVVRVFGNGSFWIEAPTISEKIIKLMSSDELSFYSYDSVMPGDVLVISGQILGAANVGRYTVVDENYGVGYYFPTATRIYTTPIPSSSSSIGLGNYYSLINIEEANPLSLLKKIITVAPGPSGYATVIVDSPELMNKVSSAQAGYIVMQNKLGYDDSIHYGIDSYNYYEGLIKELNRVIYGDPISSTQYPGIRAAGADVDIKPAITQKITISVAVRVRTGIPFNEVRDRIKSQIAGYVNTLGVGEQVSLSQVVAAAGAVNGVLSVVVTYPTYDAGNDLIFVAPDQKAQIADPLSDVTVSILGT